MGLLNDIFSMNVFDEPESKINYKPLTKENFIPKKNSNSKPKPKKMIESNWCMSFHGSHIYKVCVTIILDRLEGLVWENVDSVISKIRCTHDFSNYWYENIDSYRSTQRNIIYKLMDDGESSLDICIEMLFYVWDCMEKYIKHDCLTKEDIDILFIRFRRDYLECD